MDYLFGKKKQTNKQTQKQKQKQGQCPLNYLLINFLYFILFFFYKKRKQQKIWLQQTDTTKAKPAGVVKKTRVNNNLERCTVWLKEGDYEIHNLEHNAAQFRLNVKYPKAHSSW